MRSPVQPHVKPARSPATGIKLVMPATTDPAASQKFREDLASNVAHQILGPKGEFACRFGPACRSSVRANGFAAGQLSYVGDHYSATQDELPVRILVVSMQVGDDEAPVTLARRREQVRTRIPESFGQRNQHMMGVTTALRLLFGGAPGADREGEFLATPDGPVHVLDAYAMANSVLCSNRPGGGREGSPSTTMLRNCSGYLAETVRALQPTIVHSQGRGQSGSTHQAVEKVASRVRWIDEHVAEADIGGVPVIWCSLRHPARNWAQLGRRYLSETAVPALRLARTAAGLRGH